MRTVILGGTFNPPHLGHLFLAEEVAQQFGYERVLLVPSYRPAHKEIEGEISPHDRWEMVVRSCEGSDLLVPDEAELVRGGISYSIDTVESVLKKGGITGKPGLIIGDDLFKTFHSWKNSERLLALCELIVAHRETPERLNYPYPHHYANNKILPISSTEIRQRIHLGLAWRWLVPPAVFDYIVKKRLYRL